MVLFLLQFTGLSIFQVFTREEIGWLGIIIQAILFGIIMAVIFINYGNSNTKKSRSKFEYVTVTLK